MEIPHIRVKTAQPETYVYVPVATKETLGTVKVNDKYLTVDTEGNLSTANIITYIDNIEKGLKEHQDADEVIESIKEADVAIKEVQKDIKDAEKMINNIIKSNGNVRPAEGENSAIIGDNDNNVSAENSLAVGHKNTVRQHNGAAIGGGNTVGMTKEEFEKYWAPYAIVDWEGNILSIHLEKYEDSNSFGFAANEDTKALGRGSASFGRYTRAKEPYQFVCGAFNEDNSNCYFIVGGGTNDIDRTNLFEVRKNGSVKIKNVMGCKGIEDEGDVTITNGDVTITNGDVTIKRTDTEKPTINLQTAKIKQIDKNGNIPYAETWPTFGNIELAGNLQVSRRLQTLTQLALGNDNMTSDTTSLLKTPNNKTTITQDGTLRTTNIPTHDNDVVNKHYVDSHSGGGGIEIEGLD